jgi:hypothetical protein
VSTARALGTSRARAIRASPTPKGSFETSSASATTSKPSSAPTGGERDDHRAVSRRHAHELGLGRPKQSVLLSFALERLAHAAGEQQNALAGGEKLVQVLTGDGNGAEARKLAQTGSGSAVSVGGRRLSGVSRGRRDRVRHAAHCGEELERAGRGR